MRVIGLAGWSGAGKTTLIVKLIPVLRQRGLTVSTLGIVAGLVLSAIASRALSSMLFGVSAWDAGAYLMTPAVLALVSLVAALGPARRALRVQPIAVLRQE